MLNVNSRWLNNDATLIHEQVLLDVAAALGRGAARATTGWCSSATAAARRCSPSTCTRRSRPSGERLTDTAAGDPFDLNRFDLPGADAMVYLAGHPGEGHFLLHAIDPSVVDEDDPVSCDPALDLYDPGERVRRAARRAARTTTEFLDRYRAAQRARVERIDATGAAPRSRAGEAAPRAVGRDARPRRPARRRSRPTSCACTAPTPTRAAWTCRSTRPTRGYGSLWGTRPDWINYGAVGFGRVVSPEAWLSTWSGLSSRAEIPTTGARMTLPSLLVSYTGDNCVFPSDDELIASSLATDSARPGDGARPTTTASRSRRAARSRPAPSPTGSPHTSGGRRRPAVGRQGPHRRTEGARWTSRSRPRRRSSASGCSTSSPTHVEPATPVYFEQVRESGDPHFHPPVMEELKAEARKRGLWNLFLPNDAVRRRA